VGKKNDKRQKNTKLRQLLTGKIYKDHVQGKDKSFMDEFVNTKPTTYTRFHILLFLMWLWGFILGFPSLAGFFGAYATDYNSTMLAIFGMSVFFIGWMAMWAVGKQQWHFQQIFDDLDYTYDPATYDQVDDVRFFKIEEKIAEARIVGDIGKITECRQNIKKLASKGQISKSTKAYIKDKYYYLGID
tara:strand:- start:1271 stop:1831 length:561 start_codon:yes stop_codon:yes gene_type:complete